MTSNRDVTPPADSIGGLVDAYEAVRYNETGFPGKVEDLNITPGSTTIDLSCTVTEDSEGIPNKGYLVVYSPDLHSLESATPFNPNDAQSRYFENDRETGETFEMTLEGLQFETTYFIKVYAKSVEGKYSVSSAIQRATTKANNPPVISLSFNGNSNYTSSDRFDISVTVTDIDGHAVDLRVENGNEACSLLKVKDGLWKLMVSYRSAQGESAITLIASDEYGLETSKTIRYTKETP